MSHSYQPALSDSAWTNLAELPPHDARDYQTAFFNGRAVLNTNIPRTAKGLSKFFESFLCLKHLPETLSAQMTQYEYRQQLRNFGYPINWPTIPSTSQYHYWYEPPIDHHRYMYTDFMTKINSTYMIKPETFEDNRPDWAKEHDEELGWIPGKDVPAKTMRESWPIWTPDPAVRTRKLALDYRDEVLEALWQIGRYWHIGSIGQSYPKSKASGGASVIEAIGQRWLIHPLLPPQYAESVENRKPPR